jgi:hypothetical protein
MILGVTGHRPEKLGGYGFEAFAELIWVAAKEIRALQPSRLISGMALGWDLACVYAAYPLGIPITGVIPFDGHHMRWGKDQVGLYNDARGMCELIVSLGVKPRGSVVGALMGRNRRVVDMSDFMLACWDGQPDGGTAQCLRYADLKNKPYLNTYDSWKARQVA